MTTDADRALGGTPVRHVLVPLDGSAFAEAALPYALDVARRTGASIELLAVHLPRIVLPGEPTASGFDAPSDAEERDTLSRYLDDATCRLRSVDAAPVLGSQVLEGRAAPTIAAHAEHTGADLVVLTSHGRGGLSRYWLGSVADHLLRRLRVPLLVVRPAAGAPASLAPATLRRVLVPIDETPASEQAIDAAVAVAGAADVRYTLLRVVPPIPRAVRMVTGAAALERRADAWRAQAEASLGALERRLRTRGLDVTCVVRQHVQPAEDIIAFVEAHGTDVIALATHGRGMVERFLLGSVADKVLRTAHVPVLVHHLTPVDVA